MLGIKNQKPAVSWSVGSESLHLTSFQMDNLRKACVEMTERNGFFQASLQFCLKLSALPRTGGRLSGWGAAGWGRARLLNSSPTHRAKLGLAWATSTTRGSKMKRKKFPSNATSATWKHTGGDICFEILIFRQGRRIVRPVWRLWLHAAWINASGWISNSLPSQVSPKPKPKLSLSQSEFRRHKGRTRWHHLGRLWS